jgi:multicomponent Na+:H+ antiporter subunit E
MSGLLVNAALALAWSAMWGGPTGERLAVGFAIGFAVLFVARRDRAYHRGAWRAIRFVALYLADLISSSIRVAHDVVTPTSYFRPAVVELPLLAETDAEIAAIANLITLTPGTLVVGVAEGPPRLRVHLMYLDDDSVERLDRLQRQTLELVRGETLDDG